MKKNFRFLFVCTGDTCRAPMACELFKNKVKKLGIKGVSCSSAGIYVPHDNTITEGAKDALKFLGVRAGKHASTQLSQEIVDDANMILTMTEDHKTSLVGKFGAADKTFVLSEFGDGEVQEIVDPYGKSRGDFIKSAKIIDFLVEQMIIKLSNEGIIE